MKTSECNTAREELSCSIVQLGRGGVGSRSKGTFVANVVDAKTIPHRHIRYHRPQPPQCPFHRARKRRNVCSKPGEGQVARGKGESSILPDRSRRPKTRKEEEMVDISRQFEMVQHVVGGHPTIAASSIGRRRRELWASWANGDSNGRTYHTRNVHLPMLMEMLSD